MQHLPHAVQYFVRCFDHLAVVRGDIGLTLCRVDDQRVHSLFGVQLHVGGEACTAHAHQSAFPHCLEETLFIGDSGRTDIRRNGLFAVGFDLHHGTCPAVGHTVGGNCLDFAGNTGVDRHCHECVGIADLLPHQHGIPRLYKRCTGCTDMHAHGNPHQFRQRQRYRSTVFCVLMVCQMHAMQFLHRIQLLSLFRIALHLGNTARNLREVFPLYIYRNGVVSAIGVGNDHVQKFYAFGVKCSPSLTYSLPDWSCATI